MSTESTTPATTPTETAPVPEALTTLLTSGPETPATPILNEDGTPKLNPDGTPATETPTKTEEVPAGAPEKYEFQLPEGLTMDTTMLSNFETEFKSLNLTNEQAQKLVSIYATQKQSEVTQAKTQLETQHSEWVSAIKTDPEIGGKNLETTTKHAQAAVARYATPELKALLNQTGLGSHPELVKVFAKIGKSMSETPIVIGSQPSAPDNKARQVYPSMSK